MHSTTAAQEGMLTWRHILAEEFWEVFANDDADPQSQRAELIQVAAVAVAAIEAIDRRERARAELSASAYSETAICYLHPAAKRAHASGDGTGQEESPVSSEASSSDDAQHDAGAV